MTARIPLEGMRFGHLHVDQYVGHGKYLCTCDCGRHVTVLGSNLKNGHTSSCGCIKTVDLTGRMFGYLKVIERAQGKVRGKVKRVVWRCECQNCGSIVEVYADSLVSGSVKSCGCLLTQRDMPDRIKAEFVNGTQLSKINSIPTASNKTGVVGVNWDKSRGKWQASIRLQGKRYNLGRFDKFDDAVIARKEAEQRLFQPILDLNNNKIEPEA